MTTDGLKMTLAANIGSPQDMETAVRYGGRGRGRPFSYGISFLWDMTAPPTKRNSIKRIGAANVNDVRERDGVSY